MEGMLAAHTLSHIAVERSQEPPEESPSGKCRRVIPLSRAAELALYRYRGKAVHLDHQPGGCRGEVKEYGRAFSS